MLSERMSRLLNILFLIIFFGAIFASIGLCYVKFVQQQDYQVFKTQDEVDIANVTLTSLIQKAFTYATHN